jgi:hypothetical protein
MLRILHGPVDLITGKPFAQQVLHEFGLSLVGAFAFDRWPLSIGQCVNVFEGL